MTNYARGVDDEADFDLRLVRYFTVVAHEGNFSRAAALLHVAQPSLSRQIQRLEAQLGVRLFARTPQGSRLTEPGEAFLVQAEALLHNARQALHTARAAAGPGSITVGYVGDLTITAAVAELRRRRPEARVRTRHLAWNETRALQQGRVDALVARRPPTEPTEQTEPGEPTGPGEGPRAATALPADGVRVLRLYEEPWILVVPAGHRLVGKESVRLDDLGDEELVPCTQSAAIWSVPHGPGPVPPAPAEDDSFEDKLELVAAGYSVGVLPAGHLRATLRPELAAIPVEGLAPSRVVLAWRADDDNALLRDLRAAARALRPATPR
jgi:DNA-binding transcriptional LysR family regulator